MKVLHLIQRYPPALGGSETWCREVCRHLAKTAEMKVLTLDVLEEEEFWRDPPVEQCTIRLGRLDWDGRVLVRRYPRSLPIHSIYHSLLKVVLDGWLQIYFYGPHSVEMYRRVFSEVRTADVVHLHTVPYPHNVLGYLAARFRGKRVVITPHFHPGHPHYERWSNYWLLKHCDAVIAVSEYERNYLASKGIDARRIVTSGNGVQVEAYRPTDLARFKAELWRAHDLSAHTRAIVFLGRKLEYKGIATLVEARKRLQPERDAALFLAGPREPRHRGALRADRCARASLGVAREQSGRDHRGHGAEPLRECLKLLLTDESLRTAMGGKGHAFICEQDTQARAAARAR